MSFTIDPNKDSFQDACAKLANFGNVGNEHIRITRGQFGYLPVTISKPGWIAGILAFFGFKKNNQRLQEVAHFSLNWLRHHALANSEEFYRQLPQIKKLSTLMSKANLDNDFNNLLTAAESIRQIINPNTTPHPKLDLLLEDHTNNIVNQLDNIKPSFDDLEKLALDCNGLYNELKERLNIQMAAKQALCMSLLGPKDLSEMDQPSIKEILTCFIGQPGTTITRVKKSKTIVVASPARKETTYSFPEKIDFFLEGSIRQRKIIIKTEMTIGAGKRKIKRAFDLITRQELVSKPFGNIFEKAFISHIHGIQGHGFPHCVAIRAKRFYEERGVIFDPNLVMSPETRYALSRNLILAINNLHALSQSNVVFKGKDFPNISVEKKVELPFFHGNITTQDILIYADVKNQYRAALAGFSNMCDVESLAFTEFFRSPERTSFLENRCFPHGKRSEFLGISECLKHYLKYGQSSDIWSLGLLLTIILSGKSLQSPHLKHPIPKLKCFETMLVASQKPFFGSRTADCDVINLTQQQVDDSIGGLINEEPIPELNPVWVVVKAMLRVNPKERIKAADAYRNVI